MLVQAKNICKSFGSTVAVDGISLEADVGEIVGIVGPNGAGKSTTLRMLAGFVTPAEGEVKIKSYDLKKDEKQCKSHIGYLAEVSGVYPDLTVTEYLTFIGRAYNLDKLEDKIAEVAKVAGIDTFMHKPVEWLSKGMKQRVFLAGSLIHDPEVLIMDEPMEGLDPNQKLEMHALLKKLAKKKAILLSSHVLEEVESICSRIVVIADGKIVADETPKAFKKREGDMNKSFSKLTQGGK